VTEERTINRSVLADQVKDRLLQDIMAGRYPPHSRIVETKVARELGTSQAPVREALRGLEALGVVDIHAFRGARVRRWATRCGRPPRRAIATPLPMPMRASTRG
jgi:DNA-binding GntR family transcriptional regulator